MIAQWWRNWKRQLIHVVKSAPEAIHTPSAQSRFATDAVSVIAAPRPGHANIWKLVLLIYPRIDCETTKDGVSSRFSYTMPDEEIDRASRAMVSAADAIFEASEGHVCLEVVRVIEGRVLTHLSKLEGDDCFWPSPQITALELLAYCANGQADCAMVFWAARNEQTGESVNFPYWGMACQQIDESSYHVGYSTVSNVMAPDCTGFAPGEVFIHEWLHPTGAYFTQRWGALVPDLDGSGKYRPCPTCPNYAYDAQTGYMAFYRDYLRGRVWNPAASRYEGITPSDWRRESPRRQAI